MPKYKTKREQKDLNQWLEIFLQSAPNLIHNPISECRLEYGYYEIPDDDYLYNLVNETLAVQPPAEEDRMGLHYLNLPEDLQDLSPQLGTDELEYLSKFIPSSQLLELRRVSKVWNEGALPVLRKRQDLKFTLTKDAKRNWNFLKFLRDLPETGFLPSEMLVQGVDRDDCRVVDLEEGFIESPLKVLIDICKIFAPGGSGRTIRRLNINFGNTDRVIKWDGITPDIMLIMLRHLSASLEILDLEWGFVDFKLPQEVLDEALDLFRNIPFSKLNMIVPPSHEIERYESEEKDLIRWLNILVQSAPNLTNDPVAECKVDPWEYYDENFHISHAW